MTQTEDTITVYLLGRHVVCSDCGADLCLLGASIAHWCPEGEERKGKA